GFARERVSSAVIEFPYARPINALFVYFQHSTQQKIGWHYLDGETDSIGCGVETAIASRAITLFAPAREQFGRRAVIKNRHYQSPRLNWFELIIRSSDSQPTSYLCWVPLRTQHSAPH